MKKLILILLVSSSVLFAESIFFSQATTAVIGANAKELKAADINGDGRLDIVWVDSVGDIKFSLQNINTVKSSPLVKVSRLWREDMISYIIGEQYGNTGDVFIQSGAGIWNIHHGPLENQCVTIRFNKEYTFSDFTFKLITSASYDYSIATYSFGIGNAADAITYVYKDSKENLPVRNDNILFTIRLPENTKGSFVKTCFKNVAAWPGWGSGIEFLDFTRFE